ncbi:MAG: SIS domain-containing protein [Thermoguttaceae bacterium]|jgi:glucosamine--fructose-6-phosphate aminotransferase (isomerizing)
MNPIDPKYNFALVREMLQTPGILEGFDFTRADPAAREIRRTGRLLLTGEGSSRIFPAKNTMSAALRMGAPLALFTEGARQAHEYCLSGMGVFGASNSGRTKELISLFTELAKQGHRGRFGLTASPGSKLEEVSNQCYVLNCGPEMAVAATKSVVEQALFYRSLLLPFEGDASPMLRNQGEAARMAEEILQSAIDPEIVAAIAAAPVVYFAGRNNGVAEELTLKTNEITHKKSDYLEGTYAVHGIEEVMRADEVLIVIEPFAAEAQKFQEVLADGAGMKVIAVAAEETLFPTIRIPKVEGYDTVLQLLAGWNILVHVGVALGINLDKANRARKIGNVFVG